MDPALPCGPDAALRLIVSDSNSKTADDALERRELPKPPPFRLVTVRGVRLRPGVDLDRPRALDVQDDEAQINRGRR